jgi:hypothetical protein
MLCRFCCLSLCCGRRSIVLRRTRFDAREADFYEALYTQSRASFGAYVQAGTLLNNYAHIFDLVGPCCTRCTLMRKLFVWWGAGGVERGLWGLGSC